MFDKYNNEDVADGEDHAAEALRYALMSRPSRTWVIPKERTRIPGPFDTVQSKAGYLSI